MKKSEKELGQLVDHLGTLRASRLKAQHAVDRMKEDEEKLGTTLAAALREAKLDGCRGVVASACFKRLQVAQIVDEDAFTEWALKKKNRDVLKVSVVGEAWRVRLADGVKVPGVTAFLKESLTVTEVK